MTTAEAAIRSSRLDGLQAASVLFVVAMLGHGADHVRQGTGRLTTEVFAGGALIALLGFTTLVLTFTRHRRAALVAAIAGFYSALGVFVSHVLPHWSVFSDSYTNQVSADALSWAAALFELGAGLVLGVVAGRRLRAHA
ncbi:MAG: hypothetical protein ACJ76Z_03655 [Thermoleophilaceae bacterium]